MYVLTCEDHGDISHLNYVCANTGSNSALNATLKTTTEVKINRFYCQNCKMSSLKLLKKE